VGYGGAAEKGGAGVDCRRPAAGGWAEAEAGWARGWATAGPRRLAMAAGGAATETAANISIDNTPPGGGPG
jgi:hypothetical protein